MWCVGVRPPALCRHGLADRAGAEAVAAQVVVQYGEVVQRPVGLCKRVEAVRRAATRAAVVSRQVHLRRYAFFDPSIVADRRSTGVDVPAPGYTQSLSLPTCACSAVQLARRRQRRRRHGPTVDRLVRTWPDHWRCSSGRQVGRAWGSPAQGSSAERSGRGSAWPAAEMPSAPIKPDRHQPRNAALSIPPICSNGKTQ
jgi:hypothetical protein